MRWLWLFLILNLPLAAFAGPVPFVPGKIAPSQGTQKAVPTGKFFPMPKSFSHAAMAFKPLPAKRTIAPSAMTSPAQTQPVTAHPAVSAPAASMKSADDVMTQQQARQLLSIFDVNG